MGAIYTFIAQDNPVAAEKTLKKIRQAVILLSNQPQLGRCGRMVHTRELVIAGTPYIVPYRVRDNRIEVMRVFHSSRQPPEAF